jgi:hydrogenase nickel incorporation protein HypB
MCDSCGCGTPPVARTIVLNERLLASNAAAAEHNRAHFAGRGLFAINLMGAPGAGKTALLEATIRAAGRSQAIAVIEGDQATERDSARVRAAGAAAFQVETGLGCHLDADQVHRLLRGVQLKHGDWLFIENVGNLVCPALFDLGEELRVVVTAPTEGADKPIKYPPMFRAADVVVLNKVDLVKYVPFSFDEWIEYLGAVNPRAQIVRTSALTGEGIDAWLAAVDSRAQTFLARDAR